MKTSHINYKNGMFEGKWSFKLYGATEVMFGSHHYVCIITYYHHYVFFFIYLSSFYHAYKNLILPLMEGTEPNKLHVQIMNIM